jgi:hypothetical protein
LFVAGGDGGDVRAVPVGVVHPVLAREVTAYDDARQAEAVFERGVVRVNARVQDGYADAAAVVDGGRGDEAEQRVGLLDADGVGARRRGKVARGNRRPVERDVADFVPAGERAHGLGRQAHGAHVQVAQAQRHLAAQVEQEGFERPARSPFELHDCFHAFSALRLLQALGQIGRDFPRTCRP